VKAKVKPAIVIAKDKMIVLIFSPSAFCMAKISFPNLAESSEGLFVSNHALSYLKIASKYFILVFLAILSLKMRRNA
jgi:hypothetical protein